MKRQSAFWLIVGLSLATANVGGVAAYYAARSGEVRGQFKDLAVRDAVLVSSLVETAVAGGDLLFVERALKQVCSRENIAFASVSTASGEVACTDAGKSPLRPPQAVAEQVAASASARLWLYQDNHSGQEAMDLEVPFSLAAHAPAKLRIVFRLDVLRERLFSILSTAVVSSLVGLLIILSVVAGARRWTRPPRSPPSPVSSDGVLERMEPPPPPIPLLKVEPPETSAQQSIAPPMPDASKFTVLDAFAFPFLRLDSTVTVLHDSSQYNRAPEQLLTDEERAVLSETTVGRTVRDLIHVAGVDEIKRYMLLSRLVALGFLHLSDDDTRGVR